MYSLNIGAFVQIEEKAFDRQLYNNTYLLDIPHPYRESDDIQNNVYCYGNLYVGRHCTALPSCPILMEKIVIYNCNRQTIAGKEPLRDETDF